jgi:integrator complex subunit 3
MICDRLRSKDLLRYLTLIVKDNYQYCIKQLVVLAHDKWPKMNDRNAAAASQQQMQLVWLVKELVAIRVAGIDKVCAALLRQIQGGNVKSATNRWLASFMCTLFQEHKTWLKELVPSDTRLIAHVVYTFTRLAADHTDQKYDKMRRQEAQLCCELFQEHFSDCRVIGRDILRILQDVSRLDGFDKLWEALLNQPSRFGGLSDISDLFNVKTHPDFLRSRLTPEMEKQLVFIMQHVKMGQQQRYQRWFMTKWDLTSPESETLIADMLRFVCGAHHPPNSVIRSDVVQRWAVVGWLLKCVKSPVGLANIKLAIFYDWLFYNPKYDSVMNIEPAALLIWKSTPKWIDITVDLTEFLLAIADKWGGDVYRDRCREGIFSAARDCVQKGVIPTWAVISAYQCRCAPGAGGAAGCRCAKLSDALRCRVRSQFYTLCHSDEEKPNPDDVKLYGFVASAPPPKRDLSSPPALSRERSAIILSIAVIPLHSPPQPPFTLTFTCLHLTSPHSPPSVPSRPFIRLRSPLRSPLYSPSLSPG